MLVPSRPIFQSGLELLSMRYQIYHYQYVRIDLAPRGSRLSVRCKLDLVEHRIWH